MTSTIPQHVSTSTLTETSSRFPRRWANTLMLGIALSTAACGLAPDDEPDDEQVSGEAADALRRGGPQGAPLYLPYSSGNEYEGGSGVTFATDKEYCWIRDRSVGNRIEARAKQLGIYTRLDKRLYSRNFGFNVRNIGECDPEILFMPVISAVGKPDTVPFQQFRLNGKPLLQYSSATQTCVMELGTRDADEILGAARLRRKVQTRADRTGLTFPGYQLDGKIYTGYCKISSAQEAINFTVNGRQPAVLQPTPITPAPSANSANCGSPGCAGSPSVPGSPRGAVYSSTAGEIFWDASRDNGRVVTYDIFRNGQKVTSRDARSYFDRTLSPGINYRFEIVAVDNDGNRSFAAKVFLTTPQR